MAWYGMVKVRVKVSMAMAVAVAVKGEQWLLGIVEIEFHTSVHRIRIICWPGALFRGCH